MLVDELCAALVHGTGVSLEMLFLIGYVVSLGLIWTGIVLIGTRVYRKSWAVAALAAAFTLRHRIPRTSANSLEPYFHPRILAFGVGTLAIAAVLRRRAWLAVALVGVSGLIHVTTALWFAVLLGVALISIDPRWQRPALLSVVVAAVALTALVVAGPLRGSLTTMDDVWLQAVASKDSLFATDWPAWAWAMNLGLLAILWWVHRTRTARGHATAEDRALVLGATALVALFFVTLPIVAAGVALAVQFQVSRVFWLVDFIALVYVIALLTESGGVKVSTAVIAAVFLGAAAARGAYIMLVERPERALFEVRVPQSPWQDAMRWLARQPHAVHVLADPGHAWKYGTSVRVSAERDVLFEEVKDSALAIYSREAAVRFVERAGAVGDFGSLTADKARDLAHRYDLDYLVTEADLPLAAAYRNSRFRIYDLR